MNPQEARDMGAEQRRKQEAALGAMQALLGPVVEFDHYRGKGCPKCGAPSDAMGKRFCPGVTVISNGPCKVDGEHLHGICTRCNFLWNEHCADHEVKRIQLLDSIDGLARP